MKRNTNDTIKKWDIGEITIESIPEAEMTVPFDGLKMILQKARLEPDQLAWLIPEYADADFNMKIITQSYLIKSQGKNILVETGMGDQQTLYEENLKLAGCEPEDIDYVLFTHLHYDHVGRNTKMSINGTLAPTFPNARYLFHQTQYNHFKEQYENPEKRKADPVGEEHVWPYILHMMSLVEMGKVDFIDDGFTLHDSIRFQPAPGHTPGHCVIMIESGGESAMIGGDICHHPIQMAQTDVCAAFDPEPDVSVQTRINTFESLAGTDTLFLGMHFAGNHGGFVQKDGAGFKLVESK